ncbi:histone-like nucleoid-structuring protein Lsr2 [Streptomyces noursei]
MSDYNLAMAQKIVTVYTDDLTGEESSEATTHTFTIDGVGYEIDLNPDSFDKFLEALSPFTKAGRRVGRIRKSRPVKGADREDSAAIRAWAREAGYEVNDRGRVPAEVREAYAKAH